MRHRPYYIPGVARDGENPKLGDMPVMAVVVPYPAAAVLVLRFMGAGTQVWRFGRNTMGTMGAFHWL